MHISFVRSITMDKWSDEQLKKMKVSPHRRSTETQHRSGASMICAHTARPTAWNTAAAPASIPGARQKTARGPPARLPVPRCP